MLRVTALLGKCSHDLGRVHRISINPFLHSPHSPIPVLTPNQHFTQSSFCSAKEQSEWDAFAAMIKGERIFNKTHKFQSKQRKRGQAGRRMEEEEGEGEGEEGVKRERKFSHWKIKQNRYTRRITTFVKKGEVEEAEKLYSDMLTSQVRPNMAVFNNLISGASKEGDIKKAFKYFNQLKKRGLPPTDHTYASLFKACAETGPASVPILEKIISEIDRRDILLNTIATNSLIAAMATCGLTDDAFQVFLDMSKRRVDPDINTFTSLLSACASDSEGGMGRLAVVWNEMGNFGVKPDLFCFNALLRCLKEAGIPGEMRLETPEERVLPDFNLKELHATFDSVRQATDRASHSNVAIAAASNNPAHLQSDQVPKPHTDPNSNNRITPEQSDRTVKNVSNELSDSEKSGRPSRNFSEHAKSGKFTPKRTVLSQCRVYLHLPPPVPLSLTIEISGFGCRWMGQESVGEILDAMEDAGLTPDIHTLHILSQLAGDWVSVVRRVGVSRVAPDEKSVLAAVRLQTYLGNTGGAELLRQFAEGSCLSLGLAGYQAVALSCHTLKQGSALLEMMKKAGIVPDQRFIGTLLANASTQRHYEFLVHVMKEMRHLKIAPNKIIMRILNKSLHRVPQSPGSKLRYNGFKGYYILWRKHYPEIEDGETEIEYYVPAISAH